MQFAKIFEIVDRKKNFSHIYTFLYIKCYNKFVIERERKRGQGGRKRKIVRGAGDWKGRERGVKEEEEREMFSFKTICK